MSKAARLLTALGAVALFLVGLRVCAPYFDDSAREDGGLSPSAPGDRDAEVPGSAGPKRAPDGGSDARAPAAGGTADAPEGAAPGAPWVRVQVVDSEGRPAGGVPLELVGLEVGRTENAQRAAFATTDAAEGLAVFERPAELLERAALLDLRLELQVRCLAPLPGLAPLELGAAPEPGALHRIVLPAAGRVVVRLDDHAGRPVPGGAHAVLGLPATPGARAARGPSARAEVTGGVAVFPRVGLGLRVQVRCMADDYSIATEVVEEAGPRRAGETVELALSMPRPVPWVVGRALGAEDVALANTRLRAALAHVTPADDPYAPELRRDVRWLETDGAGRFRYQLRARGNPGERCFLVLTHGAGADAARTVPDPNTEPDPRTGLVELPSELTELELDLGDVRLELDPILVAGRVVDERGEPVVEASIEVEEPTGEWQDFVRVRLLAPERPRTDAAGHFVVRSRLHPRSLTVMATKEGYAAAGVGGVVPGRDDLELVLRDWHAGEVAGEVLVDGGVPLERLEVWLSRAGSSERTHSQPLAQGASEFRFATVEPGAVDVEVRGRATRWMLGEVRGVQIVVGEASTDPRLVPIDLRGRLAMLRVRLLDAAGAPLSGVRARILDAQERQGIVRADGSGRVVVPVPAGGGALSLRVEGYAPVTCAPLAGEQELRLVPQ